MKFLLTGDRYWTDSNLVRFILEIYYRLDPKMEIMVGDAKGIDRIVTDWADERKIKCTVYPANWQVHGKKAGPLRNQEMIDHHPHFILAFHDDIDQSKGTRDTIRRANKNNIPYELYTSERIKELLRK